MRFLRHITQVDAQTVHMALVPFVALDTLLATVVAYARAEAFTSRNWAILCKPHVGWRLQAMSIQHVKDFVVCAMVKLENFGFLVILLRQVAAIVVMQSVQSWIVDSIDSNDLGLAIVERRRAHEFGDYLITPCTSEINRLQLVGS